MYDINKVRADFPILSRMVYDKPLVYLDNAATTQKPLCVADGVNKMHTDKTSAIVITHYERLLDMIKPSVVHVLYKGRIVKTAGPELAKEIEARGYDWIKAEVDEKE